MFSKLSIKDIKESISTGSLSELVVNLDEYNQEMTSGGATVDRIPNHTAAQSSIEVIPELIRPGGNTYYVRGRK